MRLPLFFSGPSPSLRANIVSAAIYSSHIAISELEIASSLALLAMTEKGMLPSPDVLDYEGWNLP